MSDLISRRDMLKLSFAAAGAGLLFPWGCTTINTKPPSYIDIASFDFPSEWYAHLGKNLNLYAYFLRRLGLKNVRIRGVISAHIKNRNGVRNSLPPREIWGNIRPTLRVVNMLSERLGMLPEYTSVYRSPAYNARVGSSVGSYHIKNNAIDLKYPCSPGKVSAVLNEMRRAGIFRGGIGHYSSFTHVDTRGTNTDWRG